MLDVPHQVLFTSGSVSVGLYPRETLTPSELSSWDLPGVYCLWHVNAREVGSSLDVGDAAYTVGMESPWWTTAVLMATDFALTPEALAYAEDRLAHMMKVEGLPVGLRTPRSHSALAQDQKALADDFLLSCLGVFEAEGHSLISTESRAERESWVALTAPLLHS